MDEITKKNTLYLASYSKRDMKTIADMYTDDCRFMPAGFPLQKGKDGEIYTHTHSLSHTHSHTQKGSLG